MAASAGKWEEIRGREGEGKRTKIKGSLRLKREREEVAKKGEKLSRVFLVVELEGMFGSPPPFHSNPSCIMFAVLDGRCGRVFCCRFIQHWVIWTINVSASNKV